MANIPLLFIVSIITTVGYRLLYRTGFKDYPVYAYTLLNYIFCIIFIMPFAIFFWKFNTDIIALRSLIVSCLLWTVAGITGSVAISKSEVTLREPLSQIKTFFGLMFGVILFNEHLYIIKIVGVLLITISGFIAFYKKKITIQSFKEAGVFWIIFAALLSVIVSLADKVAMNYYDIFTYAFLIYLIPSMLLATLLPWRIHEFKKIDRNAFKTSMTGSLLQVVSVYATLILFRDTDFSVTYPILQIASIVTALGAIFILKEKTDTKQRIIALIIAIIGALCIKLGK